MQVGDFLLMYITYISTTPERLFLSFLKAKQWQDLYNYRTDLLILKFTIIVVYTLSHSMGDFYHGFEIYVICSLVLWEYMATCLFTITLTIKVPQSCLLQIQLFMNVLTHVVRYLIFPLGRYPGTEFQGHGA